MTHPADVPEERVDSGLDAALAHAAARPGPTALLVVALAGLDIVRGIEGRAAATAAGAEVRHRLAGLQAEDAVVVPLDGGDVAVVCPGTDHETAERLAERIVDLVGQPIHRDRTVRIMANVGLAVATDDLDPRALVRDADTALAAAVSHGPGTVEAFAPDLRRSHEGHMETAVDLADALATGEQLFLHYQPVFELNGTTIVGAEALVRWRHPVRGLVAPDDFVPVAEQSGLIGELGTWVLDAAARQLALWQPLVSPGFRLHVNLSPVQARRPRLADDVCDVLDRHGISPGRLLLEITETGLMTDGDTGIAQLARLREAGVGVGIDDFGTGYSSISRLRDLPVDMVKVDRSLTALVASSSEEYALTRAIFGLVRSSGLDVIAEGIEEHAQLAHLRALRCPFGQGYLLARPGDADLVTGLLRSAAV